MQLPEGRIVPNPHDENERRSFAILFVIQFLTVTLNSTTFYHPLLI